MEMPWKKLEEKVVMVTGASTGLGRELCFDLAKAGCRIVAAARRTNYLMSLCHEINGAEINGVNVVSSKTQAVPIELDVAANEASIEGQVFKAWSAFGRIDVLVNNAGFRGGVHFIMDWSEEEANKIINTNQIGLCLVSKHVCRLMCNAKVKGNVINVSSISSLRPFRGDLPYSTSKVAVNSITKSMALELGEHNIKVNSICLSLFKSEITSGLMKKSWINKVAERIVPLKTWGTSNPAFTSLVRYLIHDSSQYVTGNDFIVDCGYNLGGIPLFSSL